jgi:geranylgeranyl pyrophosphate synthase
LRLSAASDEDKIRGIKGLYEASGVLEYCTKKQQEYQERAMNHLAEVECNQPKQNLFTLAEFITNRSH